MDREYGAVLAELRDSFDKAEASIERGRGIEITPESLPQFKRDIIEHCRARLLAEKATDRAGPERGPVRM